MSLTRKMLKGMSLTDEQVDSIIENHTETVNGLKDEISKLTEEKETLATEKGNLEKENKSLQKFKDEHSDDASNEMKEKYDKLKKEYDDFKSDVANKEQERKNKAEYRKILKEAGILEKKIDTVLKASGDSVNKIKFDKDGNIENKEELLNAVKDEWKELIGTTKLAGADVNNPPEAGNGGNTGGGYARQRAERIKAQLYGNTYNTNGEAKKE